MKFDTKVVRSGISPDPSTGAIVPPIYQSATYVLEEIGKDKGYDYTRASNPTREILENNLAALDGGKYGICFSSGMAAVDSVMKILKSGDHVVCSDDVYGGVSRLYNNLIVNYDISFSYVNSSNPKEVEDSIQDNTKIIWIETPTNPLLKVTDLDAVGKIAKKHGILYGVDSTFSTPALLRPLEFGADIVQHSTTKYQAIPVCLGYEGQLSLVRYHDIVPRVQPTIQPVSSLYETSSSTTLLVSIERTIHGMDPHSTAIWIEA